jgi:hypothetical protein
MFKREKKWRQCAKTVHTYDKEWNCEARFPSPQQAYHCLMSGHRDHAESANVALSIPLSLLLSSGPTTPTTVL